MGTDGGGGGGGEDGSHGCGGDREVDTGRATAGRARGGMAAVEGTEGNSARAIRKIEAAMAHRVPVYRDDSHGDGGAPREKRRKNRWLDLWRSERFLDETRVRGFQGSQRERAIGRLQENQERPCHDDVSDGSGYTHSLQASRARPFILLDTEETWR